MYLQTQGLILRQRDWREHDKLITVYTEKAGKLGVRARGIRKIKSKLRGHLREFALVDLQLVRGARGFQLIGADLRQRYKMAALINLSYGFYFLETIDKLTREEQANLDIFSLLQEALAALEVSDQESRLKLLRVGFLFKALKHTGFNPEKRVLRETGQQVLLSEFLNKPLTALLDIETNGQLKSLFKISQFALNETVEAPLQTVKFLRALNTYEQNNQSITPGAL